MYLHNKFNLFSLKCNSFKNKANIILDTCSRVGGFYGFLWIFCGFLGLFGFFGFFGFFIIKC